MSSKVCSPDQTGITQTPCGLPSEETAAKNRLDAAPDLRYHPPLIGYQDIIANKEVAPCARGTPCYQGC